MTGTIGVDKRLVAIQDLKISNHTDLDALKTSNHTDFDALKTSNHADLDALKSSIDSLADWLKKKLAYSFDFDLITKNLEFSVDDLDNWGHYYIPSSEFEVGKSYLLRIRCSDDFSSWGTVLICLPVGDFIIGGVTTDNRTDAFTKYSYQMTTSHRLLRSGSTHGMYNDAYVLGTLSTDGAIYLWAGLQRCSDS